MKNITFFALILAAAPLSAAPEGRMATMPLGRYLCELPGSAAGPVGIRQESADFAVTNGSTYAADGSSGSYLLSGDELVITSGPRNGQRYRRLSTGFVRLLAADGSESALRCIRRSQINR